MNTPTTHLTKHTAPHEGKWSLIHNGMPLTAPVSKEEAEAAAKRFKLNPSHLYWDAESGTFTGSVKITIGGWAPIADLSED